MTRILIDPPDLYAAARQMLAAAGEYDATAAALRGPLPAMPATVLPGVEDSNLSAASSLGALASELRQHAVDLLTRARAAEIAGGGGGDEGIDSIGGGQSTSGGLQGSYYYDHATIDQLITRTEDAVDVQSGGWQAIQGLGMNPAALMLGGGALGFGIVEVIGSIWGGAGGELLHAGGELGGFGIQVAGFLEEGADPSPLGIAYSALSATGEAEQAWNSWPRDPSDEDLQHYSRSIAYGEEATGDALNALGDAALYVPPLAPFGLMAKGVGLGLKGTGMLTNDAMSLFGDQIQTGVDDVGSFLGGLFE